VYGSGSGPAFSGVYYTGAQKFIFSLGYKSGHVIEFLEKTYPPELYEVCIEPEPLGTGGGTLLASRQIENNTFLLVNGDTLFDTDLSEMARQHALTGADLTISLKEMQNVERYGTVRCSDDHRILGFDEKRFIRRGLINGGVYLVNKRWLTSLALPEKCSFEHDILEAQVETGQLFGFESDGYFIDIGIPEDFERAGRDLAGFFTN
jgi:D-glycero-alpha-D-manno-heptose 1-phosphate guanylyltransferase